jgi:ribonuclease HI
MPDKQCSIFDLLTDPFRTSYDWKLYTDGASKGNPGPSGVGFALFKNDEEFLGKGFFIGEKKTNNEAEYAALLTGIYFLKKYINPDDKVLIIADSEILIKQMKGEYKVKKETLRRFNTMAHAELAPYNVQFKHILREHNSRADAFANEGVKTRETLPLKFLDVLQSHDIYL